MRRLAPLAGGPAIRVTRRHLLPSALPSSTSRKPRPFRSPQVVCAGSRDTFQVFVWSLKTGRLLEVLAAHEGPVVALQFCPGTPLLASASWDK